MAAKECFGERTNQSRSRDPQKIALRGLRALCTLLRAATVHAALIQGVLATLKAAACNSVHSARNPLRAIFFGSRLVCTFAKALFCRRRRRASGAFEGLPALKPVFDSPYACAVPQLGPQGRKERTRAGNLFRKWLRLRGQSIPRAGRQANAPLFFFSHAHECTSGVTRRQRCRRDTVVDGWPRGAAREAAGSS